MKLYASTDVKTCVASPAFSSVAGNGLCLYNDAAIAIIANGNRHKNKFSSGFRILLTNTSKEMEKAIRVEISKKPNWYPSFTRITPYTLTA